MSRDFRKNGNYVDSKVVTFSVVGVAILATVVFGILMYGKNVDNNVKNSQLSTEQIASIAENNEEEKELEKVNSDLGKSVEEAEKEKEKKVEEEKNANAEVKEKTENTKTTSIQSAATSEANQNVETSANATKKETIVRKELEFQKPVEGEITQKFAKDSLIYSSTLAEWVTHMGIDIKADKATVVNSAEEGIVKSIKNDPRYGLTIVISHQDGFETIYANLLSSEFVKEGDKVTKGQAIGTVGNTGVFESAEEPHLHFEILKDSTQVDPSIYLK